MQRVDDLDGLLKEAAASADEQQERVGVRVGWRWGAQQVQVVQDVQHVVHHHVYRMYNTLYTTMYTGCHHVAYHHVHRMYTTLYTTNLAWLACSHTTSIPVEVDAFEVGVGVAPKIRRCANGGGVCYSCSGHRDGAYNPCPKWARIYRPMTESGSKAFPTRSLETITANSSHNGNRTRDL